MKDPLFHHSITPLFANLMLIWLSFCFLQFNPFQSRSEIPKSDSICEHIELTREKKIELKVELSSFKFGLKKNVENPGAVSIRIKGAEEQRSRGAGGSAMPKIKHERNKGNLKIDILEDGGSKGFSQVEPAPTKFFQNIRNECNILMPEVPLYLDISVNSAALNFSGLKVVRLNLSTAGNTKVSFPTPNPVRCEDFHIFTQFSGFKGEWLGNAGAETYYFRGGVGIYALDFRQASLVGERGSRGAEEQRSRGERKRIEISIGVGKLKLILPSNSSVRLKPKGMYLKSNKKLARDENGWYIYRGAEEQRSRGEREFIIHVDGSFGILEIEWNDGVMD